MTQVYDNDSGEAYPVTLIDIDNVKIVGKKNIEKDGYFAVILGLGKKKNTTKSERVKYKKIGFVPAKVVEFRIEEEPKDIKIGQDWFPEFEEGSKVNVRGRSKGKGFAGVVKRWGFKGGPKTHGQSDRWRSAGSIGAGTSPGRVFKGKKMPGRMGDKNLTVENLRVIRLMKEEGIIAIRGAVPGHRNGYVLIN